MQRRGPDLDKLVGGPGANTCQEDDSAFFQLQGPYRTAPATGRPRRGAFPRSTSQRAGAASLSGFQLSA